MASVCDGVLEQRSLSLVSDSHADQLMCLLRSFRARCVLFDFSIRLQDETLPCHRCVLAACSDFFRAMFELDTRERDDGAVTLTHLSAPAVHSFLDFAYSGEIEIRDDNVDALFQLASFLQVDFLSRGCSEFLSRTLDLSNCLHLLSLSESYGSSHLLRRASEFVMKNFIALSSVPEFVQMSDRALEICIGSDELQVPSEESVLWAVIRWAAYDFPSRVSMLAKMLALVRLHHLPSSVLEEAKRNEILSKDKNCVREIQSALVRIERFAGLFTDARLSTTASYIFVHKSENTDLRYAFCYDVGGDRWTDLSQDADSLISLSGSALVSFGEKIFIIGGCRGECSRSIRSHIATQSHNASDEVWRYCPASHELAPAHRMQFARTLHSCVSALKRIYAIGGKPHGASDATSILDVEYLDPLRDTWTSVSPLPKGIYFPEASVCGSVIYLLGSEVEISETFNPLLDCFFRYDAIADQWCQLVAEFGQFFHATLVKSVCLNNTLYLCDLSTYKVYSFCADESVWKGEGSFECAGFNASAVGVQRKIYILGGDYSPDEISDEVQVYDSGRSQWTEISPMPRALTEFHCLVLNFSRHSDPWRMEEEEQPEI